MSIEEREKRENEVYLFGIELANQVSKDKRLLILSDTVDATVSDRWTRRNNEFAAQLNNTVIILAGRPYPHVLERNEKVYSKTYKDWINHGYYKLSPFSEQETELYYERMFPQGLDAELIEKIFILTNGNPVLIAITGEWLSRHIGLPASIDRPVEELRAQSETELEKLREQFEFNLVDKVRQLKGPTDWAVLYLSWINRRYDPKILKVLLGIESEEKLAEVVSEIETLPFTRQAVSTGGGLLHDEAARLVKEHAWPSIDPNGSMRRKLAHRVIKEYYIPEINRLQDEINAITRHASEHIDISSNIPPIPDEQWLLRALQVECLDYWFRISRESGEKYLEQLISEALESDYLFLEILTETIYNLSLEKSNLFQIQIAELFLARNEINRALDFAKTILDTPGVQAGIAARALNILGETAINPQDKIKYFEAALEKATEAEDTNRQITFLNNLGRFYRLQGQWHKAVKTFRNVLNKLDKSENPTQYANTMNNMAYVTMQLGHVERADNLAEKALRLRRETANRRGLAFSYFTKGNIADAKGNFTGALRNYQFALGWFNSIQDTENAAWVQVYVAQEKRREHEFVEARALLTSALACRRPDIRAEALSQAAKVNLDEAEALSLYSSSEEEKIDTLYNSAVDYAQQALELAEDLGNRYLVAITTFDLALIAWLSEKRQDTQRLNNLENMLAEYDFPLVQAHIIELRGTFTYEQGDMIKAFTNYTEACRILAEYSQGRFQRVFSRVRARFLDTAPEAQKQICNLFEAKLVDIASVSPLMALKTLCIDELSAVLGGY
jgi:tetratricopeptide (TPR) repeat protein